VRLYRADLPSKETGLPSGSPVVMLAIVRDSAWVQT